MKTLKYLALLLAAAMFLVACGTSENGDTDDTGTLIVNVVDADTGAAVTADITVTQDGAAVDTQTGVSTFEWEVEAGSYTVAVSNADGYLDLPGQTVNVPAGDSNTYTAEMVAEDAGLANVDALELSFVDVDGNAYDNTPEINEVKDAILVAAQTEEQVGVEVLVTDAEGEPVANAPVTVSVTGDFSDALAIYPGQAVNVAPSAAQTFQGISTDDDGMAYFVIEATNADLSWQEILNFEEGLGEGIVEPTKLIVSAVGGDNVAKRVEFKSFFTNMSHLWYGEGEPGQGSLVLDEDSLDFTEQRLGRDFGEIINIWEQTGDSDRNVHYFGTWALTKQPSYGPFPVGTGLLREIENGEPIIPGPVGLESAFGGPFFGLFPGRMEYTITDVSTDGDGDPLVEWYDNGIDCDSLSSDGLTCTDDDGSGVGLSPVSSVSLEDLPVEATVQATYYFEVVYGNETYEFALKDYTFTKRWIGSFLEVDKYVDQHVLTWAGPDVTLGAADDPDVPSSDYTSTVNVTVSNGGDATIYQITVRDGVPAELGVITDSISDGGTYDPVNHTVTWNNVPELQALDPGDEFTLTFDVYARHKPGFCWDGGSTANFVVPEQNPLDDAGDCITPYDDPYLATNGAFPNSVTAAGFFEDDVTAEQLVFSYAPIADESDIWVVRPLIELDKELLSADTMTEGAAARFAITARQRDRVSTSVDPSSTEYAFLNTLYPWEFTGALSDGDGHVAEGQVDPATNSEVRGNPYLHDVDVNDAFEVGLDFTQGIDFDGSVISPSDPRVVGKDVDFNTISTLPRGTAETATITLTGNLISDDGTVTAQNGATAQIDADPAYFAWRNCAYLGAPQLNQPAPGTVEFDQSVYAGFLAEPATYPTRGSSNLWLPDHFQIDGSVVLATELVEATDGTTRVAGETGQLEACDEVAVIPPPPSPLMTLTTNGEVDTAPTDGVFDPATLADGYNTGDTFYYVLTAANAGAEIAEDVTISVELTGTEVRFNGTAELYVGTPETWTTPPEQSVTLTNQSTFTFAPVDVAADGDPEDTIRIVLTATANQVGVIDLDSELDYSNAPGIQSLPLMVTEETTIQ
jgi:hypothetical protein